MNYKFTFRIFFSFWTISCEGEGFDPQIWAVHIQLFWIFLNHFSDYFNQSLFSIAYYFLLDWPCWTFFSFHLFLAVVTFFSQHSRRWCLNILNEWAKIIPATAPSPIVFITMLRQSLCVSCGVKWSIKPF